MAPGGGPKTCAFVSWPGGHFGEGLTKAPGNQKKCHGCGPTKARRSVLLLITLVCCVCQKTCVCFADVLQHCCRQLAEFCRRLATFLFAALLCHKCRRKPAVLCSIFCHLFGAAHPLDRTAWAGSGFARFLDWTRVGFVDSLRLCAASHEICGTSQALQ